MKATLSIRLLLMIVLTGVGALGALLAQAQEASVPVLTANKPLGTPATSVKRVEKKPMLSQRTTARKVAPSKLKQHAPIAAKAESTSDVLKTKLPPAQLDLSLPQDMVRRLEPLGAVPLSKNRPLLPQLFVGKNPEHTPFQLNGRLLKNEMDLQLRNENRKEVDGAALDFEFKQ